MVFSMQQDENPPLAPTQPTPTQPPATQPSATQPGTQSPGTQPPATQPPATQPPATQPQLPATEPEPQSRPGKVTAPVRVDNCN